MKSWNLDCNWWTLHFWTLNFISHFSDHRTSLSRSRWRSSQSCNELIVRYNRQSSANNLSSDVIFSVILLMYIRNSSWPCTVPCGTPDDTETHCDDSKPTTTRWRFEKKLVKYVSCLEFRTTTVWITTFDVPWRQMPCWNPMLWHLSAVSGLLF